MTCMFKIMNEQAPQYLINLVPKCNHSINTKNSHIPTFYCRTDCFKYSFFPYTIVEWNKLENTIRNSKSFLIFRNSLLKIGRPIQNSIFNIHDPLGIKLLTRLRLGLSHLNEHRLSELSGLSVSKMFL